MPAKRPIADAPLKPHFFLVLLALADGPSHGYRIKQIVEARGTLLAETARMADLVAAVREKKALRRPRFA